MSDFVKSIFNPAQRTKGVMGQLGASGGAQGGRFGHLGGEFGSLSQYTYNPKDHFDAASLFDVTKKFDPTKLLKRY